MLNFDGDANANANANVKCEHTLIHYTHFICLCLKTAQLPAWSYHHCAFIGNSCRSRKTKATALDGMETADICCCISMAGPTKTASALQTCLYEPGIRSFRSSELPNKAVYQLAASKLHHREKLVSPLPNISLTNQPQCPSSSPWVLHASITPLSLSLQLGLHSAEELSALYFCCLPVYAVWIFKRSSNHHIKQLRVPIDRRFKQLQRVI